MSKPKSEKTTLMDSLMGPLFKIYESLEGECKDRFDIVDYAFARQYVRDILAKFTIGEINQIDERYLKEMLLHAFEGQVDYKSKPKTSKTASKGKQKR